MPSSTVSIPTLGLRANAGQFTLLVAVTGLVGGMIGQERTVLPLLARDVFGLVAFTAVLSFVLAFGVTKAWLVAAALLGLGTAMVYVRMRETRPG